MPVDSSAWELPLVKRHYDPDVGPVLAEIWANRNQLLDLLDQAPSTLCHLDFWPPNLFAHPNPAEPDSCTIAIDWAYAGKGAIGEDIANLTPDSLMDGFVLPKEANSLAEGVLESYIDGLRQGGYRVDTAITRFVYGAAMAVKYVWMTPRMLQLASEIEHSPDIDSIDKMPLEEAFAGRAAAASVMARLGADALRTADRVEQLLG